MQSLFRPISRLSLAIPLLAALGAAACDSPSDSGRGRVPAAVEIISPNPQAGTAGAPLPAPVAVRVVDDRDRPVAGQAVSFVVTGGGGSVSVPTVTTDAQGLAQVTWTLGTNAASPQTLEARVANGATTFTAAFTATISAAAPATVTPFPAGDTVRVGTPGAPVTDSLAVLVRDAFGNPVPGAQVTWTADTGGGTLASPTTTDAQGVARTRWTLGGSATEGHQLALGSVPGVGVVRFHARVATAITRVADTGDGTTSVAGAVLLPRVLVTGPWGGVQGAEVRWQVTGGGGTVTPAESLTGSSGFAAAEWTLGATGTQTLTATVGGLTTTFTATVLPQGNRTLVAQVPGTVLDARADRILWLDTGGAQRLVKIRTVATGSDVTVKVDTAVGFSPTVEGYLFNGGALVWSNSGQLFEYRAGTLAHLGRGRPSTEGEWAAWNDDAGAVIRRDLAAGTNLTVAPAGSSVDVGPDGDVVFLNGGSGWLYSGGTLSQVTLESGPFASSPGEIATDGVNVVYTMRSFAFSSAELLLDRPGGDVLLASHSSRGSGVLFYRLAGGWAAYNTPNTPVRRRSPAGNVETVTVETTGVRVEALAPDGTLIYATVDRYFLVPPDGTRRHVGPAAFGERIVWRVDRFLLISGGSVYRLAA